MPQGHQDEPAAPRRDQGITIGRRDSVSQSSEDSFPASDPPAWTGVGGPRHHHGKDKDKDPKRSS